MDSTLSGPESGIIVLRKTSNRAVDVVNSRVGLRSLPLQAKLVAGGHSDAQRPGRLWMSFGPVEGLHDGVEGVASFGGGGRIGGGAEDVDAVGVDHQ